MALKCIRMLSNSLTREMQIKTTDTNFHRSGWQKSNGSVIHTISKTIGKEKFSHDLWNSVNWHNPFRKAIWQHLPEFRQILQFHFYTSDWLVHTQNDSVHKYAHCNTVIVKWIELINTHQWRAGKINKVPPQWDILHVPNYGKEWGHSPPTNEEHSSGWWTDSARRSVWKRGEQESIPVFACISIKKLWKNL